MVGRKIRKQADGKRETGYPVIPQADGGSFDHCCPAPLVCHPAEGFLHFIRLRRCVLRLNHLIANHRTDGADQAGLDPRILQNGTDHIRGGGLSFRSRKAHNTQILRGMPKIRRREHGKRIAGILHQYDGGPRYLHLVLRYHRHGSCLYRLLCIAMAVCVRPTQADKRTSRLCLARIINEIGDFQLRTAGTLILQPFQ